MARATFQPSKRSVDCWQRSLRRPPNVLGPDQTTSLYFGEIGLGRALSGDGSSALQMPLTRPPPAVHRGCADDVYLIAVLMAHRGVSVSPERSRSGSKSGSKNGRGQRAMSCSDRTPRDRRMANNLALWAASILVAFLTGCSVVQPVRGF